MAAVLIAVALPATWIAPYDPLRAVADSFGEPLPPGRPFWLGTDEPGYANVDDGTLVAEGLDALDERERQIVELRFFHEMTQSQIASEIGISQMHVSRLLRRALATMRGRIEEQAQGG